MIVKAKLSDLKVGLEVRNYPDDTLIQVIDYITSDKVVTHYKIDPLFHLGYPIKKIGHEFYELYFDDYQGVLL